MTIAFEFDGYNDDYNNLPIKNEFVLLTLNIISEKACLLEAHITFTAYGKASLMTDYSKVSSII